MRSLEESSADVLIAGTGAGGATFGYALAKAGRSVLFVEQGPLLLGADALTGSAAEAMPQYRNADHAQRREILIRCGRNPELYKDGVAGDSFVPTVGYGTGGSTSLYGMALERRFAHDFEAWPVPYQDLAPWYTRAETLYEVCGTEDPFRRESDGCKPPTSPLSPANETVFAHLKRRGLHPYRLHLAWRRLPGCRICQGYLCPMAGCKRDALVTCLLPALETGNARLLSSTRVLRLESDGKRVTAAVAERDGKQLHLTAKLFVLAAGALSTPRILLHSGVANRSGLVGRRLMRHAIDLFVLSLAPRHADTGESKELGLNDYYAGSGESLGTLQSFGMAPSLEYLRNQPGRNIWRMLGVAAAPVSRLFQNAPIVASVLADQPVEDNRVELSALTGRIVYRLTAADKARRSRLRRKVMLAFARFAPVPVFGTTDRQALGHACGTAVMGADPLTSVVNEQNRAHDVENLYVVDASFFPTSGGVNPALTVMANALRVADHVHR
ncbi:MAG: GMC family oxidoreductase, partial [Acidobacteria bacterium]|nr:GMC family oxidoreductase [Acidobacteriota bacterium]